MTTIEQIKDLHKRIETLRDCLDIAGKRTQVESLQKKTEAADFWDDPKAAQVFLKNLSQVKAWVTDFDKAYTSVEDLDVLYEFSTKPKTWIPPMQGLSSRSRTWN